MRCANPLIDSSNDFNSSKPRRPRLAAQLEIFEFEEMDQLWEEAKKQNPVTVTEERRHE